MHPRIFGAHAAPAHEDFDELMASLYDAARRNAADEVRSRLGDALPGYRPDPVGALDLVTPAPYPDDY